MNAEIFPKKEDKIWYYKKKDDILSGLKVTM